MREQLIHVELAVCSPEQIRPITRDRVEHIADSALDIVEALVEHASYYGGSSRRISLDHPLWSTDTYFAVPPEAMDGYKGITQYVGGIVFLNQQTGMTVKTATHETIHRVYSHAQQIPRIPHFTRTLCELYGVTLDEEMISQVQAEAASVSMLPDEVEHDVHTYWNQRVTIDSLTVKEGLTEWTTLKAATLADAPYDTTQVSYPHQVSCIDTLRGYILQNGLTPYEADAVLIDAALTGDIRNVVTYSGKEAFVATLDMTPPPNPVPNGVLDKIYEAILRGEVI